MATDREPPTATDYIVTALSPVLVMLMVGSLVFFLVEVLYEGQYSGRLLYTLFFFVVGAVLIARIAIESDASRASLYGLLLGGATYIALLSYVDYPSNGWLKSFGWLINLGLMLLIWWSAHKLTWDCTHIDERRKGAGRGLLSAAGLDADAQEGEKPEPSIAKAPPVVIAKPKKGKKRKKQAQPDSRLWDWIERYQKHREDRRKSPHTPGVWVIYFALAALPLFALGQSLIHPDDAARRHTTFLQMVVYVGSALGLLVTTSLLGLRRYLRQRKAKIPMSLAGGWLGLGALFIVVFLLLGAFFPRPHSEVPWFGIPRAGKTERDASKYAMRKSGAGKGDGASGNQSQAGDGQANGENGEPGGGKEGEKSGKGKGKGGKGGSEGKGDQSGGSDKGDGGGKDRDNSAKKDDSREGREGRGGSESQTSEGNSGSEKAGGSQFTSQLAPALQKIAEVLKWLVFAIVAVLVVVAIVLGLLRYLAPFTLWAQRLLNAIRNWWAGLWNRGNRERANREVATEELGPLRPPPFHTFANPFEDGSARRRSPHELVAYTFLALDSWAWDRDLGRATGETPLEFIARLEETFPELQEAFAAFAKVYARVSYSGTAPPTNTHAVLVATWDGLVHGVAVSQ